jgi:thermostable 8-oxoguanine DNA glycosylase
MTKEKQVHIRITDEEKEKMLLKAKNLGFKQLSEYLRFVGLNSTVIVSIKEQ